MRKKYLFDGYDIIYDDITAGMVTVGGQDIDIDAIINSVSQKINQPSAGKKMIRKKRITLGLIAAILVPGLLIFALGMAELLFNMDEPVTQEMRNEVEQENQIRYHNYRLKAEKYRMEHPDENFHETQYTVGNILYDCAKDKINKVKEILQKYGYDTEEFDTEKLVTFEYKTNSNYDLEMFCHFMDTCCDGINDHKIAVRDKVYIELQLENGLSYFLNTSSIVFTRYGQKVNPENIGDNALVKALYNDFIGKTVDDLPDTYKKDFELIRDTRNKILDTIGATAFAVDFNDIEAVKELKQKIIKEYDSDTLKNYSIDKYDISNAWDRLQFVIHMTDMMNYKKYMNMEEYNYSSKAVEEYEAKLDYYESAAKEEIKNTTGKSYSKNDKYYGMKMEDYLASEKVFRAVKEPFGKVIKILNKYGYSTDITYESIICGEEFFNPPYYENYCRLIDTIYDMTDKNYKEMTVAEKKDLMIFLYTTTDYYSIYKYRYHSGCSYIEDKLADERGIRKGGRNMGNPAYVALLEEMDLTYGGYIENHKKTRRYYEELIAGICARLTSYYSRWRDFEQNAYLY